MKPIHMLPHVIPHGAAARGASGRRLNEMAPTLILNSDPILHSFLELQAEEGLALARSSDILELDCLPTGQHFVAHYSCRGLVRERGGLVREAASFHVGFFFGADYLRSVNPFEVLTLFGPPNTFHPNVAFGAPFICVGRIAPGMPLVDLLYQVYEILTFQRLTPRDDDALNKEACRWARANQGRFPIDPRPLKRRTLALEVEQA